MTAFVFGLILWQVSDELDVCDDHLVLQQQVFEEDVFPLQRDGLGAEQTHQQLCAGTLQTGSTGAVGRLLWKTQRLQYAVLTWDRQEAADYLTRLIQPATVP